MEKINNNSSKRIIFDCGRALYIPDDSVQQNQSEEALEAAITSLPYTAADVSQNKTLAILISIFPILFFLPLVLPNKRSSKYLKYYIGIELVLTILCVTCVIVAITLRTIPVVSWLSKVMMLVILIIQIINLLHVYNADGKRILFKK